MLLFDYVVNKYFFLLIFFGIIKTTINKKGKGMGPVLSYHLPAIQEKKFGLTVSSFPSCL